MPPNWSRVDYEILPSVTDTAEGGGRESSGVGRSARTTSRTCFEAGNKAATEAAFAHAVHIVKRRYVISRVYAHFMEPRRCDRGVGPGRGALYLYADVQ